MPRFTGGAVGYIGYEYITRIERTVPPAQKDELGIPLIYFMLSDTLVIFDRVKQTLQAVRQRARRRSRRGRRSKAAYAAAVAELESLETLLRSPRELAPAPLVEAPAASVPPGNFTRAAYERTVESVKEYIRAGDIIQVVPSQRFSRPFAHTPLDLYRALRSVNPSPYMFVLDAGDFALVGASPEVHVRLTDGLVEIRPIAGTRQRGATPAEDLALEKELLADDKERAEHLMLVDLGPQRHRPGVHVRQRPRPGADGRRAVFPRDAHRLPGRGPDRARQERLRPHAGDVPRRHGQRGSQDPGDADHRRKRAGPARLLRGGLGYFSYDGNLDSCITLADGAPQGRQNPHPGRRRGGGGLRPGGGIPGDDQQGVCSVQGGRRSRPSSLVGSFRCDALGSAREPDRGRCRHPPGTITRC